MNKNDPVRIICFIVDVSSDLDNLDMQCVHFSDHNIFLTCLFDLSLTSVCWFSPVWPNPSVCSPFESTKTLAGLSIFRGFVALKMC